MESIGPQCTELKKEYDECFNKWYSEKFLRGDLATTPCQELFEDYKACLLVIHISRRLYGHRYDNLSLSPSITGRYQGKEIGPSDTGGKESTAGLHVSLPAILLLLLLLVHRRHSLRIIVPEEIDRLNIYVHPRSTFLYEYICFKYQFDKDDSLPKQPRGTKSDPFHCLSTTAPSMLDGRLARRSSARSGRTTCCFSIRTSAFSRRRGSAGVGSAWTSG